MYFKGKHLMRKNVSPKKTARNWDEAFTSSQYPLLFAYLNLAHILRQSFDFPVSVGFSYFHQISQKIRSDQRNTHIIIVYRKFSVTR